MTTLIPSSPSTLHPTWHPVWFIPTEEALPVLSISFYPFFHPTFTCIYSNFCPGSQPLLLTASGLFSQLFTNLLKGRFGTCQSQNQTPSVASPLEFYIRGLAQSLDLQTWSWPCPINSWGYPLHCSLRSAVTEEVKLLPSPNASLMLSSFPGMSYASLLLLLLTPTQHSVLHLNAICSVRPSLILQC